VAEKNNKWLVFLVVAAGVFMSTLDSSMVNIALPTIMHEFHSPLNKTEWVVLIYLLTITATLLFWGHLSDRLGRRRVYAAGMFIFALASLGCAYSQTLAALIMFRFVQALGAAMLMSSGPAIIKETFPPEKLGRSLGLIGVAVSLGLMTGPSVGGLLIEFFSWRSIFLVTVPLGFLFTLLAYKNLPATANGLQFTKIDWHGALSWAALLTALSLALTHLSSSTWSWPYLLFCLLAALFAIIFFIRQELITLYPILPLKLFKKRYFTIATLCAVLSFIVLFSAIMLIPFYLDRIQNLPPSRIGLIMMALPLSVLFIAPIAGWVSDHIGRKIPATLGLFISSAGVYLMTKLTPDTSPWQVALHLAILGLGQAMFLSPNSASVLSKAHANHNGISAAMLATSRNLGMLLGIATASLVFSLVFSRLTGGLDMRDFSPALTNDFMTALSDTFYVAAIMGLTGTVLSWLREPLLKKHA
jgi:EmrB/QacA subfamily drug resistance transporter